MMTKSVNILDNTSFFRDETVAACLWDIYNTFFFASENTQYFAQANFNKERYVHAEPAAHVETVKRMHAQTSGRLLL